MLNKGDLFYVPSETLIFGKGKIVKMPEPTYMINLREVDTFYETFFENQKGSANEVNLNYSIRDLGGGNLIVSLTGKDPFSGKKTTAMNLQYKVNF